ncbi:MAG: Asp-tRNA(Asn)/Glu-tRNA(Gln) amidotransferase subunit GatA [Bdellovibrionales bacterium]|jgi:aspartyl-tRNA(Asn)/glutamyl-tRNA(Gln) amidotransferase subunit A|nr:Asp-tRNA(Asn)/Glu-tRNA(Gln) amidotransferase subunit GatA [Bdellovibrionales bacterium]
MSNSLNLDQATCSEIRDAVRGKKVSAVEVTNHFQSRVKTLDPKINAFVSINEKAEEAAKAVDEKIARGEDPGILAGIPMAVKDLLCTKGLKTTASSKMLANFIPPYSATVVKRLEAAGAVTLGKTSLDEFAMGSSNENAATGPVRNPWNPEYVPGGSSGGSAAAIAARMAPGAIGTDTGGSIRQPASFCGLFGMKPTYGRVSRYGIIAFASSLDQAGPMALSTKDCALILEAISGSCEFDSTSASIEVPKWSEILTDDVKGLRIGLPKEYFAESMDADVERVTQEAIAALKDRGAEIVEVSLPLVKHAVPVYYLVATSEASSNLARYDGMRYGHRTADAAGADLDEVYSRSRGEGFGSEVKRRIMLGTYALSSGYYDAFYQKASQVRRLIRNEFLQAFESCDVILSPVSTTPAFKVGERINDPLQMYLNDIFTTSTNLAGLPGMSVPAGYSASGLPIGVQLMGRHFDEARMFNVSLALENALGAVKARRPHVI